MWALVEEDAFVRISNFHALGPATGTERLTRTFLGNILGSLATSPSERCTTKSLLAQRILGLCWDQDPNKTKRLVAPTAPVPLQSLARRLLTLQHLHLQKRGLGLRL